MSDESNVAYGTEGLRQGAQGLTSAQEVTLAATTKLQGARLTPGIFGRTAGVGAFTGAVGAARAAQARGFRAESERSGDLGRGSATAATMGDRLTAGTTAIAASARAS
jgi:hypothetical protein